ncbi:MAG: transcriptional repressor LexA [Candidatus Paceibacterota bacterium]|jgi:site-specific DNA-methyltransferase (adenine-specific)
MLTRRQKEVLDFVKSYSKKHGYSPSLQEIQKQFKFASVSTAHFHISKLQDAGYIKKQSGKARSIDVSDMGTMVRIPLLGYIAAGQPIDAIEDRTQMIAFPASRVPATASLFALTVQGDSMIDEDIYDGDVIVVKQQNTARNGDTVVALIDNEGATVKKFYKEKRQIRLQPANDSFEPIIIKRYQDLKIQGVVIDVIKHTDEGRLEESTAVFERQDVKKLPRNKIILGDAIQELKKLPSESCDVIIIDPPYNIGKDFGNNIDKREIGEYIAWCKAWISESIRILKPSGTIFIYGFSEILAHLSVEVPLQKRWLIWHYTNKNMASLNFWQRSHEAIICAWKGNPIFNRDNVREPYTEGFLNGAAGKMRKGTLGRFSRGGKETIYKAHEGGALPRDVIKTPALAGGAGMVERWFLCKTCNDVYEPRQLRKHEGHDTMKHPTQKPLEITRRLLKSCLPEKEAVVLVPFAGTGSECVVARELGADYIGIEINPDYVQLANGFLKKTNKMSLG